jgi:tripartite-type tricarboxylate transporter receptor subunit TctC
VCLVYLIALFLMTCAASIPARAEYPDRLIRLIVPQAAGSATDTFARIRATELAKDLGQQRFLTETSG